MFFFMISFSLYDLKLNNTGEFVHATNFNGSGEDKYQFFYLKVDNNLKHTSVDTLTECIEETRGIKHKSTVREN